MPGFADLPKITIITPSFNQGAYIEDTICSVLNQHYPNLEFIIVDGGSTDGTEEVVRKYAERITKYISEPDHGQAHAINKGLKLASGEIVAWLNSDDQYLPGTLDEVAKTFVSHPEAALIYGDVENFNAEGYAARHENPPFDPVDFLSRVSVHQPAVFWKKSIHNQIGYLDERLHYLMDYDLWVRIFFNYSICKTNKVLSRFRLHTAAKTYDNPPGLYREYREIFCRFINSLNDRSYKMFLEEKQLYFNPGDVRYNLEKIPGKNVLDIAIKNYLYNCAIQEYTFGNRREANRIFLRCLLTKKIFKAAWFLFKNNIRRIV